jgi:hypothetical protein
MIKQVVRVVTSRLSFIGEKSFGHYGQMKMKKFGRYIIFNAGVILNNTVPFIVGASGRVSFVEINFQILNYSYKILN